MNREIADDIVKELINLGADDTLADSHKETAYHFAARYSPDKLQVILLPFLLTRSIMFLKPIIVIYQKSNMLLYCVFRIKPHSTLYSMVRRYIS